MALSKEKFYQLFPICCEFGDEMKAEFGKDQVKITFAQEQKRRIGKQGKKGVQPNIHTFVMEKKIKKGKR